MARSYDEMLKTEGELINRIVELEAAMLKAAEDLEQDRAPKGVAHRLRTALGPDHN